MFEQQFIIISYPLRYASRTKEQRFGNGRVEYAGLLFFIVVVTSPGGDNISDG
jgi:hypothetical protein